MGEPSVSSYQSFLSHTLKGESEGRSCISRSDILIKTMTVFWCCVSSVLVKITYVCKSKL